MRSLPAFFRSLPMFLLLVAVLAGCSGAPPRRIFPPELSLQELRIADSGDWTLVLRVRSFSTVPMQLEQISGSIRFADTPSTPLTARLDRSITPNSVELFELGLSPNAETRAAVAALGGGGNLRYELLGELESSDPNRDFEFEYRSALSPVPGLTGVLR